MPSSRFLLCSSLFRIFVRYVNQMKWNRVWNFPCCKITVCKSVCASVCTIGDDLCVTLNRKFNSYYSLKTPLLICICIEFSRITLMLVSFGFSTFANKHLILLSKCYFSRGKNLTDLNYTFQDEPKTFQVIFFLKI